MSLIDSHGRRIRKLRLSLTDKCNLRCHYCMPLDQTFMDEKTYLSKEEIYEIIAELVELGLEEIRLTGGEPLLRKSFPEILQTLSSLKLKKLALTTNGILLDRHFDELLQYGVHHLNISLDSLRPETFRKISHGDHFHRVMRNILKAKELGFVVKLNAVMMKGINDQEILDFVEFSARTGMEVRFLELMRIGYACEEQADQFISAQEMMGLIQKKYSLKPVTVAGDSTSFNYLAGTEAQIGFIASESKAFCGACSRWRLSADGVLRACLLKEDGLSIKGVSPETRIELYYQLLGMKPLMRPTEVGHAMNLIGG